MENGGWRMEDCVGLVEDVGGLHMTISVTLDGNARGAPERTSENSLVGGEPAEAVVGQDGQYLWTDCPLRWPHPTRCLTKGRFVGLDGQAYLLDGVFRVTKRRVRQRHVLRVSAFGSAAINEKGKDRMIVG